MVALCAPVGWRGHPSPLDSCPLGGANHAAFPFWGQGGRGVGDDSDRRSSFHLPYSTVVLSGLSEGLGAVRTPPLVYSCGSKVPVSLSEGDSILVFYVLFVFSLFLLLLCCRVLRSLAVRLCVHVCMFLYFEVSCISLGKIGPLTHVPSPFIG